MNLKSNTTIDTLLKSRGYFFAKNEKRDNQNFVYFSELFNDEQSEKYGKVLAGAHRLQKGKKSERLLNRLEDNEHTLFEVRKLLIESVRQEKNISPASVWFLDNYYLIEEQIAIARKHLPKGYSKGLPYVVDGDSSGIPRIYDTVSELISHSDGRVDIKGLSRFIASYQSTTLLTLGELWAIPIMLRLAVIENLRRVGVMIALDMIDHHQADYWADALMQTLKDAPEELILTAADMARSKPELTASFVAEFVRNLRGKGAALALPLSWLEQQLALTDSGIADLIQFDNQKQASDQISISNSIGTLRFLGKTDWPEFVETLSSVDQVLRKDLTGTYPLLDFATRDRYRQVVETISKASLLSETEVALKALEFSNDFQGSGGTGKPRHIGYYLIDKGLKHTEDAASVRYSFLKKLKDIAGTFPVFIYLAAITLFTIPVAAGLFYIAISHGINNTLLLTLVGLVALAGSAQLAISLVNWLATIVVQPTLLPRLDFSNGIAPEFRSIVVVPTMLANPSYIDELLEGLEIRFLANNEPNLHFALLTDALDADKETLPNDEELVKQAATGIDALNEKYASPEENIFFLFHRPRVYNKQEGKWMGFERKRGKLSALNALLRDRSQNEFSTIIGNYQKLTNVKYVITLDSDTRLPHEAAWKLIGTMAHPLNKAIYCPKKKRVIDGYGILQPRVEAIIPFGDPSLYVKMQGQLDGIDPYTRLSSDVYQDLFGEGSFIGKGIYDVDIFEQCLDNVFPENRILSHDLLEGCYCRSGLVSNVVLYDESPSKYEDDVKRNHRWIRGDWQIGAWMLPFISTSRKRLTVNRLSTLSRWKIFDNLRRSLLPLSLMLLLLAGWFVLPFPWLWTLTVTFIVLLAIMAAAGWHLIHKPEDISIKAHIKDAAADLRDICIRFAFDMAVLPYQAYKYTHAILIANWRMIVSRQKLLQWTPSAAASTQYRETISHSYQRLWIAPVAGITCAIILALTNGNSLLVAAPILALWIIAPAITLIVGKEKVAENNQLSNEQTRFLLKTARKTWAYFQEFVTGSDNWLPPDNYQEQPVSTIAHRTSPTNMGLSLLANLAAYDFGFITANKMAERCASSIGTMEKMDRYQGHFFNWYDTQTLEILRPAYVSTVDSGNLIGHLFTLRQGLLELPNEKLFDKKLMKGLLTTADVLWDIAPASHKDTIQKILTELTDAINENSFTYTALKKHLETLIAIIGKMPEQKEATSKHVADWIRRLEEQVKSILTELEEKIPWLYLMPVPEKFMEFAIFDHVKTPIEMQQSCNDFAIKLEILLHKENTSSENGWLSEMNACISKANKEITDYLLLLDQLADQCEEMCNVSYDFLYNKSTSLLSIGYNVDEYKADTGFYDLMASEARLGIFVGIAQGKLPQKSWFVLGRLLTNNGGDPILLSWSGSMFEYLMPQVVMPVFENTLLHQTGIAVVKRQMEYAEQRNVPWGISESGYNAVDANLNYQYKAFGVPGLGLKRGLEDDLVIAPYASMLALMVSPIKAFTNLHALSTMGVMGDLGFYEAIDYTPARVPRGQTQVVIQSYMVHHQGMALLALAYVLLDKPMQKRFTSELRFKATLLLLQERIPKTSLYYAHTTDLLETRAYVNEVQVRKITSPNTLRPEIQLLSNGRYSLMITNAGGGYSRWKDVAINRWREDATCDNTGIFCYIKDVASGHFWSNTHQPTLHQAKEYEVLFSQGHVEFRRKDFGLETYTEIIISPEDDVEMRRIRITNRSGVERVLEITSYAEVVIAGQNSDEAHPAFSNLFVQTRIEPEDRAIYCTRRPRSQHEAPPWLFHRMDVQGTAVESVSYDTDRMQFVGRGHTLVHPRAIDQSQLSGHEGSVLDPIMAIRYRIRIKPNQTATFNLVYGISETKDGSEALMRKYADANLKKRAFELFWTHNQVLLRQIKATEAEAQLYSSLASSIIFSNPLYRASADLIRKNQGSQPGLWSQSISGDLPIVLLHVHDEANIEIVRQLVQAHAYWRLKGLEADLVIWNENPGTYLQQFQERILELISLGTGVQNTNPKQGNIFVKMVDQLSTEERILFESVAKIILDDQKGSLTDQVNLPPLKQSIPSLLEIKKTIGVNLPASIPIPNDLHFFNGTGGFTPDGKEYKIITTHQKGTPAPWVNVLANTHFGTVVSESGAAYTWALNAHEYRITPWSNDPVSDSAGEALYLRDEDSGLFWSPTPYPVKGNSPYITTHGFGYSLFDHAEEGIVSNLTVFVDKEFPIKFLILKVRNQSGRERTLSATGYMDIVLGDLRSKTNMHIVSEMDSSSGALIYKNRYNAAFAERVGFFKILGTTSGFTADRSLFIGRNRHLGNPAAMYRKKLSGKSGAGFDPCAALQVKFDLIDGEEKEIIFLLGNEANDLRTSDLLTKFSTANQVFQSLESVKTYWKEILNKVQITTPDMALNILANGWLSYQTIACRLFARSGFYQSGGAFGFRDQLQDVIAVLHSQPKMAREQIVLHASRQFTEGDVQHWWHPPEGRGVRTRCSDDMLWLPYVVARYLTATGDYDLLHEKVSFLESRTLHHEEDSFYDLPIKSNQQETIYEHCVRAIRYSLKFGIHGLPLMGAGDWNDGMDQVGNHGKGESVWLGFFLFDILNRFSSIATRYNDNQFAETCLTEAASIKKNVETSAWDGEWYLRAWFDDGTPIGSRNNSECRIDAIAQSWSVLSGAGKTNYIQLAMQSLDRHLVDREKKLLKLLDPAFDKSEPNPGYIKGYVPGIRENGGQYSHAAIWALMAFAQLGDRQKVWELFSLLQPVGHATDEESVQVYKVEPYVMAADVYANPQHQGRGGWTWYTGSAGWMYQFITGSLLGIQRVANTLTFLPCFPTDWPAASIQYQNGSSLYSITIYQVMDASTPVCIVDNVKIQGNTVEIIDDGLKHSIEVFAIVTNQ